MFEIYKDSKRHVIEWNTRKRNIVHMFGRKNVKFVTRSYLVVEGKIFNDKYSCNIGFHFSAFILKKIELFDSREGYESKSTIDRFNEKQKYLKQCYGEATDKKNENVYYDNESLKFERSTWKTNNFRINHSLFERFGIEEHLHIVRR